MTANRSNVVRVHNGETLSADAILESRCFVIVISPPKRGPAVDLAMIRLPRAADVPRDGLIIVRDHAAFGYEVVSEHGETIAGRTTFSSVQGARLVPLLADHPGDDAWGVV